MATVLHGRGDKLWQAQRLDHARQSLQANWQGNSQAQFQAEMDASLRALRRLAYELTELSRRLEREAARWEIIGSQF